MVNANELLKQVYFTLKAHGDCARKPSKAFRKWDGSTPYAVHPLWCATTLLHETALPEELRVRGAEALLYHDILEDTTLELVDFYNRHTSVEVMRLVVDMTFKGGSSEEMLLVWQKSAEVRLLKLYDKVSNLLDAAAWMDAVKLERYRQYTRRLADDVAANFGELSIVKIARAISV